MSLGAQCPPGPKGSMAVRLRGPRGGCENSWYSLVPTEHLGSGKGGDGTKWRLKASPVQKQVSWGKNTAQLPITGRGPLCDQAG